ncbi:MAG: ADP-ribosylglycohydrolase family protein [Oscillospiraceae bacterium]|nr:ADP-ribosylglycohydrolase family protein [Oscillospiraceae bacterium]MBR1898280.1 ADP-ribosylglycohydrolase family protein [Oscillospiraceae bacterium]
MIQKNADRCVASLLGGAAGDALGYAVEFMSYRSIQQRYGPEGIRDYTLDNGCAVISDDTQMTLFTAEGMLLAKDISIKSYVDAIRREYLWWFMTQTETYPVGRSITQASFLMGEKALFANRAPGNTCISALAAGGTGTPDAPINASKGCGGVMRVAPIGLFLTLDMLSAESIMRIGARAAALTHGHTMGWIPAAVLTGMVRILSQERATVDEALTETLATARQLWPKANQMKQFLAMIRKAARLAESDQPDERAISQIGEGWVGDEALAIALFCALRYEDDFDSAIRAAVNHSGDSDSTGAVTGNILGARLGMKGIPMKYTKKLELCELIARTGTALAANN